MRRIRSCLFSYQVPTPRSNKATAIIDVLVMFCHVLQMKHYKFETCDKSDLDKNGNLLTLKASLQPWEFVQFLSTGSIQEDIQPGKVPMTD